MDRRDFLKTVPAAAAALSVVACGTEASIDNRQVMTVRGRISSHEMGFTLSHEHLLVNFQSYEERQKQPLTYNRDEVAAVVHPHLAQLRGLGCRTLVDCTPPFLGRDAALLRRVSEASGLHILTATGNYAARDGRFLPSHVFTDSEKDLAQRWSDEWYDGIGDTGVRPGMIKLGFNGGPLTDVEQKLINAAAIAHLDTGLTIGAHTGPAVPAFEQLSLLAERGVHPSAWIWIHAQNEEDLSHHLSAARRGAWISFDGIAPDSVNAYTNMVTRLRDEGLLHRVLVSHDAGWYSVGEPGGGDFRTFDTVFTSFIPALRRAGFTADEINTLFIENPASAFAIGPRRGRI